MRGGSQAQLLRCSDGSYQVVKFANSPQGIQVLANELIGTLLAQQLGLPVADVSIVEVSRPLVLSSDNLLMELGHGRVRCQAGLCFGSRHLGIGPQTVSTQLECFDVFPYPQSHLANLSDFLGMMVFDLWTCNRDNRQVVFVRVAGDTVFRATMIDQGSCFNQRSWLLRNLPPFSWLSRSDVHPIVRGIGDFEPWLSRLEQSIDISTMEQIAELVPPCWYARDRGALTSLLQQLDRRRRMVRDLLDSAIKQRCILRQVPPWLVRGLWIAARPNDGAGSTTTAADPGARAGTSVLRLTGRSANTTSRVTVAPTAE